MNKSVNVNTAVFQIKKVIKDIRDFNGEWRYTDTFERFVNILNSYTRQIDLPIFQFEQFHYSSTGKTINDLGYNSLINHIDILEEMFPYITKKNQHNQNNSDKGNLNKNKKKVFVVHGRNREALLETENILTRAGLEPIVLNSVFGK